MGKKYLETKENSLESSVLGIWQEAAKKADELDEAKFSPKEIKMAIGVASDKRYAGGNMTGAVKAIDKIKRGLSGHPQVAAVLKRQNEDVKEAYKPVKSNHKFVRVAVKKKQDVKKIVDWINKNSSGGSMDVMIDTDNVSGGGMSDYSAGNIYLEGDDAGDVAVDLAKKFKREAQVMGESVNENITEARGDGFLRLTFNSPADVKKAMKVSDTEFGYRFFLMDPARTRPELEIEGDKDSLQDLKKFLKKAKIKFKVDMEESVNEAQSVLKRQNEAKLDPVNKKALKKDFDDRKDKDIDNDGDVDSSDKYLAKRRKAVSKAISKEENELDEKKANFLRLTFNSPADVKKARKWMDQNLPGADQGFTGVDYRAKDIEFEGVDDAEDLMKKLKNARFKFKVDHREENELDVIENTMAKVREFKIQDMKAALAQVWGMKEGKNPFKKEEEEKPVITKGGKTLTGKKPAEIDVKPKIKE